MKRLDRETLDALAGEYVLGTLGGAARRRFERMIAEDPAVRARVDFWERKLGPLSAGIPDQAPSPAVWEAIVRETGARPEGARPEAPAARPARRIGRRGFWLGFGAAAAAAAAAALVVYTVPGVLGPAPFTTTHVALLGKPGGQPVVLVDLDARSGRYRARLVATPPAVPGHSHELWLIPKGGKPVSLGVLPANQPRRLPAVLVGHLADANAAVSVEPPNGSPTGAPTGPVVYQGHLYAAR